VTSASVLDDVVELEPPAVSVERHQSLTTTRSITPLRLVQC
jgi:hypothetical protein